MANRTLTAPEGFRIAAVKAGIKPSGNLDLGLIVADAACTAAASFTTNKIVGPAVEVSRNHIKGGRAQAVFVNAGNANTSTGKRGLRDVMTICRQVGNRLAISAEDVLVCSTGIIGHPLPMAKVRHGIELAAAQLSRSERAANDFSRAIMTTDLKTKTSYRTIKLAGKSAHIAGTAKGSGMIAPNMATMLAFLTTDADISAALLKRALKNAVNVTFNKVSVDNHMSTNDTAIVLASGMAGNKRIANRCDDYQRFEHGIWSLCDDLARQMAADGEGATCMVTVTVCGAATAKQARAGVRAIVQSPLVRTAFNGADPNWGRIVSAIGYSGATFDPEKIICRIAGTTVFRNGGPVRFDAGRLSRKMKAKQWEVKVNLNAGTCSDFCYTCDLSREYVTINADYHT